MKRPTAAELVRMTLVPVALGLAAGVTGALMAESYLAAESIQVPPPIRIGRADVSVTEPLPDVEVAERLHRAALPLYPRAASSADVVMRARTASEAVGYAAVLTSDGWLATHQAALAEPVAVAVDGRLLEPTAQVADPRTGAVFLKIDAAALPVGGFEDTDVMRPGTPLHAPGPSGLFMRAAYAGAAPAADKVPAGALRSSERFSRSFRLDRALGLRSVGGPIVTAGGNLAGIAAPGEDGAFIPMHLIRPLLAAVFRGQEPSRAALGVHYLPLGETVFAGQGYGELAGARLTSSRALGLPAVREDSAAARAGLLEGDVILAVDDVAVSGGRDLAELLAERAPRSTVRLDVLRADGRRSVEVAFE